MDGYSYPSYPYSENAKSNKQNHYPSNYMPVQTHSSTAYYPGINHLASWQSKKQDNSKASNSKEFPYWDDKLMRNESQRKFDDINHFSKEANLVNTQHLFSPYNDLEQKANYQQRDQYNQWCSSNFNYPPSTENNAEKINIFIDESIMNKCYHMQRDSKLETHKRCITENNYCLESNFAGNNTTNIREGKYNVTNNYNYFEYLDDYTGFNNFLSSTANTPNLYQFDNLDQQTEASNDESDIIVEESDDEITDFSEDQDKKITNSCNKCIVCNVTYVPLAVQFYFLTSTSPVTMTSQQPVFMKLKSLIGPIETENNHICRECLGLINSIDHFQSKLTSLKKELQCKFRRTCDTEKREHKKKIGKLKQKKGLSSYHCKFCSKTISLKNYVRYHIMKHRKRRFLCEKCGVLCRTLKRFHEHTCQPSVVSSNAYSCSHCSKFFRTRTRLKEHQNFCLGILPFVCKLSNCGKKFSTATRLKNHIKLKHDKKFIAICSICNIGFVKLSDYKSHKVTHSTDKKYMCQKCDKSYKTLSNLNFHLKSHAEALPFLCNSCGKGFMRKEYLETHVNNHKDIKNFVCSVCSKKFSSQKNLDSHFKYHDGSIQKKICNICGKSLTTSLNEHLRIHTNLREFECNQCDLKFNTKGTLAKHKKIKHNGSIIDNG